MWVSDGGIRQAGAGDDRARRTGRVAQRVLHAPNRRCVPLLLLPEPSTCLSVHLTNRFYADCSRATNAIGNACGTVGILHAVGNMRQLVKLRTSSSLVDMMSWFMVLRAKASNVVICSNRA